MELSAIPPRIFTGRPESSWITHKRNLLNANTRKKSTNAIRENATNDKGGEFNQETILRRVAKIPISKTFDGGWGGLRGGPIFRKKYAPFTRYFPAISNGNIYRRKKKTGRSAGNVETRL